ncbi:MAG: ribonuclease domain-containing protein [Nitrospira sp.]
MKFLRPKRPFTRSLVVWLLAALLGLAPASPSLVSASEPAVASPPQVQSSQPLRQSDAPPKAYELLKQLELRAGVPLPGYVGGRDFHNRERRLPRGRYREYDVNPRIRGRGRDAERLVIEQRTGKAYYSGDHYRTFVPLN